MTEARRDPRVVFAGDRDVAVETLRFLRETDTEIVGLLLPEPGSATHDTELTRQCPHLDDRCVLRGDSFREEDGIETLRALAPDYIVAVHFQYIVPERVLELPEHGVLNLHPAYLPYNRGWHTPTWAIWDQTPYGATLHFMEPEVDAGDIVARREEPVRIDDTADSLYDRVKRTEIELFEETWPSLAAFDYDREPQSDAAATSHTRSDITELQRLELDETIETRELLRQLRALTTNDTSEAAWFEHDGERYRVQVEITPETDLSE